MKIIMMSFLFALSLSASATTYYNCKISELDEVGSSLGFVNEVTVAVDSSNPKTTVIGKSNGREYQLGFNKIDDVDAVNICVTYSKTKCDTLAATKNTSDAFLFVKDLVNSTSIVCHKL